MSLLSHLVLYLSAYAVPYSELQLRTPLPEIRKQMHFTHQSE